MEKLSVDVAIVGGGIMGAATALACAKSGMSVALIDKGMCGAQASGINAGGVRQQGRALCEMPISRRAAKIWPRLHILLGESVEFQQVGHLRLARSEADVEMLEKHAKAQLAYDLHLQLISGKATREMFPWISSRIMGSSLAVEDGHANPRLVTPAYARAARAHGVHVRESTRIENIQWTGSRFEAAAKGLTVHSRHLVNTAGAWGSELLAMFGESVPMTTRYPNLFVTEPVPYFMTKSIAVCGGAVYFRQVDRGNVVIGGGPGWGDLQTERARNRADTMLGQFSRATELVPELEGLNIIRSWSGLEGDFADKLPVISLSETTPNLVHCFGFCGHGFQMGPAMGEILCELVRDGQSPTPLEAFHIGRFRKQAEAQARAGAAQPAHAA